MDKKALICGRWAALVTLSLLLAALSFGACAAHDATSVATQATSPTPSPIPLPSPFDPATANQPILIVPDQPELTKLCTNLKDEALVLGDSNSEALASSACSHNASENDEEWGKRLVAVQNTFDSLSQATRGDNHKVEPSIVLPEGARAYAMFLAPNNFQATDKQYGIIRSAYYSMCSTFGSNKTALWFSVDQASNVIDKDRSRYYAAKIASLDFTEAPFAVITALPPQELHPADTVIVLRLSGLTADEIAQLFVFLEQNVQSHSLEDLQGQVFLRELAKRIYNAWQDASGHPEFFKLESIPAPANFLFRLATQ